MEEMKLNAKQLKFCEAYVGEAERNAEKAVILAGYSDTSPRKNGWRMLQEGTPTKKYIDHLEKEMLKNVGINKSFLVERIANIADIDVTQFFDDEGNYITFEELKQLPSQVRKTIKSISFGEFPKNSEGQKIEGSSRKILNINFHSLTQAQERLIRMGGHYDPKNIPQNDDYSDELEEKAEQIAREFSDDLE